MSEFYDVPVQIKLKGMFEMNESGNILFCFRWKPVHYLVSLDLSGRDQK